MPNRFPRPIRVTKDVEQWGLRKGRVALIGQGASFDPFPLGDEQIGYTDFVALDAVGSPGSHDFGDAMLAKDGLDALVKATSYSRADHVVDSGYYDDDIRGSRSWMRHARECWEAKGNRWDAAPSRIVVKGFAIPTPIRMAMNVWLEHWHALDSMERFNRSEEWAAIATAAKEEWESALEPHWHRDSDGRMTITETAITAVHLRLITGSP